MKPIMIASVLLVAGLVLGGCVDETGGRPGPDHGNTSNEREPRRVPPEGAGPTDGRFSGTFVSTPGTRVVRLYA